MSKHYTHKRLDELFAEISVYYAGIITDLEERLANPMKQFGAIGKPVKATAAKNLKNQEDCLAALDAFGLAESKRLFTLTKTHHTDHHVYKARKDFAREFHKILTAVFQEKSEDLPDAPCQKLPRVANLMKNKRTGKTAYDIDAISGVVSEYIKHEHRDHVSSPKHHHRPPPPPDGGMSAPTSTYKIDAPDVPITGPMPQVPTHKPTSNKATGERVAINLTIGGGRRRRTHRRSHSRRRKTSRRN